MREQELNARMLTGDGGDLVVELFDPGGQPREQLEVIIAAPCGMRRQRQRLQSGETPLGPQRGAQSNRWFRAIA
jgi:hypothetical protein